MKTFKTTTRLATLEAKRQLREQTGLKRLSYVRVEHSSMQCNCGESYAVLVTTKHNSEYPYTSVGVCEICGKE